MPTIDHALASEQPYGVTITTADDVAIVQMIIPRAGTTVPQHAHVYDHTTMVAVGAVRIERAGKPPQLAGAGDAILVPAGEMHCLTSLVDRTICYCVHNVSVSGAIEVSEENSFGCVRAPGVV